MTSKRCCTNHDHWESPKIIHRGPGVTLSDLGQTKPNIITNYKTTGIGNNHRSAKLTHTFTHYGKRLTIWWPRTALSWLVSVPRGRSDWSTYSKCWRRTADTAALNTSPPQPRAARRTVAYNRVSLFTKTKTQRRIDAHLHHHSF